MVTLVEPMHSTPEPVQATPPPTQVWEGKCDVLARAGVMNVLPACRPMLQQYMPFLV